MILAALVSATPASADPSAAAPDPAAAAAVQDAYTQMRADLGQQGMVNQEDLNSFRSWIDDQPGFTGAGFYEAAVDIPGRTMTLLWHGSSPLQAAAVAEGAKRGLTVVVKAIPYTRQQVEAASAALLANGIATSRGTFTVASVGGPVLGDDRLTVTGSYAPARAGTASAAADGAAVSADAAGIASAVASRTGLGAVVAYGSPSIPYTTRATDSGDLNAGGMIKGADGSGCSSGFAIVLGGVPHTTTARHCNATPYHAWSLSSTSYGSTTTTSGIGLARVLSARGFYWMFDGAWNNSSGYHKTVNALADVSLGSHVCSSGANSGVHCNLVVDQMNESFNDGLGGSVTTIRVHQASGGVAGAHGDSGGPILIPNSDGTHVWAVGMLQGSNETQTNNCGSLRVATSCSAYVEFTSERTIVNSLHATLRTG